MDNPDHDCVPRWWPHHIGDTCRCDICGHCWVCCKAQEMSDPTSAKAIQLGLLDRNALGWRTAS